MVKMHCNVVLLIVLFMVSPAAAEQILSEKTKHVTCDSCHGFPPLETSGKDKFNSGAHLIHKDFVCSNCHNPTSELEHENGVIEIRPELYYDLGTRIPWPGYGGGGCGGDKNKPMPSGCHSDKIEMKCYWIPGKVCKPVSTP